MFSSSGSIQPSIEDGTGSSVRRPKIFFVKRDINNRYLGKYSIVIVEIYSKDKKKR